MRHVGLGLAATLGIGCFVRAMSAPAPHDVEVLSRRAGRDLSCVVVADEVERLDAGGYRVRACGREVTYGCFVDGHDHFVCLQATMTPMSAPPSPKIANASTTNDPFEVHDVEGPWPEATPTTKECPENPYGDPCD